MTTEQKPEGGNVRLSAELDAPWRSLQWNDGPPPDGADGGLEHPYLCLIDWQHFNPKLTAMRPKLEVCYALGGQFMVHDDDSLVGPVKCVRAWARI